MLNTARRFPGSILLKSKKAFCFCGHYALDDYLNSIESIQIDSNVNWKTLAIHARIAKTFHLAAASLFNSIVLFGGRRYKSLHMYILNEEGKLEHDLSSDKHIPGGMCFGSFIVHVGRIFAKSNRKDEE